jgi:Flp pilus assembly pilin Flp
MIAPHGERLRLRASRPISAARAPVPRTGRDDRGATATEYAMLVAFIAVIVAAGIILFGQELNAWFEALAGKVHTLAG